MIVADETLWCCDLAIFSERLAGLHSTVLLAGRAPWIITSDSEHRINVAHVDEIPAILAVIPFFGGRVQCCAVSPEFHLLVIASDRYLFFHSLPLDSDVRSVMCEGYVPELAVVTPGWGFVVVYGVQQGGERVLVVYSVNGELIRSVKSPRVARMTAWRSERGFDFIALATERGKVFVAEAFFLDFRTVVHARAEVLEMAYLSEWHTLAVVTTDGRLLTQTYMVEADMPYHKAVVATTQR
jgi:hypothetical protein